MVDGGVLEGSESRRKWWASQIRVKENLIESVIKEMCERGKEEKKKKKNFE